jgi:hypothetical protein
MLRGGGSGPDGNSYVAPRGGEAALWIAAARDTVRSLPHREPKPMPEAKIAQAVELLDLMLEHFADDGHWMRGRYDDQSPRRLPISGGRVRQPGLDREEDRRPRRLVGCS